MSLKLPLPQPATTIPTAKLIAWLKAHALANKGGLPEFSNAEARSVMGITSKDGQNAGRLQSRVDFACYKLGLPPLGMAADEPYGDAWKRDYAGWEYPVAHMAYAVRARHWAADDFNKLDELLAVLPGGATEIWRYELKEHNENVRSWAYGFVSSKTPSAISKAGRNPPWTRDELILALRLYMRHRNALPSKNGSEIAALSRLLKKIASNTLKRSNYWNASGVYMKLMNFRSLDPQYTEQQKSGLANKGADDLCVWKLYANDIAGLDAAADAIEAAVRAPLEETGADEADEDDIADCEEGRILTRMHRYRERNRKLADEFKQKARKKGGGKYICGGAI